MADYGFYVNDYMGAAIPEAAFPAMEARAREILCRFQQCYCVVGGPEAQKMAVCAMAEVLYRNRHQGVSAATAGSVSVRYPDPESAYRQLWRELYQKAATYLDIYRGVVS